MRLVDEFGSPMGNEGFSRSDFLLAAALVGGGALLGWPARALAYPKTVDLPMVNGRRLFAAYPQKRPLIVMTQRPVQLETPMNVLGENLITPNDAFFVRWHNAGMPTEVDGNAHRITVHGRVKAPLTLSIADLKNNYEQVEFAAVNECSGNSRGFFEPRVPGGQWGNGAVGNAKWKGVRLREILNKAGLESDALQVRFKGLDLGVLPTTPQFVKALDLEVALGDDVIVAHTMNGADMPLLNGYPARLVVAGWFATYWVKMLSDIEVISEVDQNFWMKTAYRVPADPCLCSTPGKPFKSIPINRLTVRSFITNVENGATVPAGRTFVATGFAFDSGYGIKRVLFSTDGGKNWSDAKLTGDTGRYGFRGFTAAFKPVAGRSYTLATLAMNGIGEAQRFDAVWNPPGYTRNIVETVSVKAV